MFAYVVIYMSYNQGYFIPQSFCLVRLSNENI